jgi:hypothetical protein
MHFIVITAVMFCADDPLMMSNSTVAKAYAKLSTAEQRTVNRLNSIIKDHVVNVSEELLQQALIKYEFMFDKSKTSSYLLMYLEQKPAYRKLLDRCTLPNEEKQLIALYSFRLNSSEKRAVYLETVTGIHSKPGLKLSTLPESKLAAVLQVEDELVKSKTLKPFLSKDIRSQLSDAYTLKTEESKAKLDKRISEIVKSKPGTHALDLTSETVKRAFDLQDEDIKNQLVEFGDVIDSGKYGVPIERVFQITYNFKISHFYSQDKIIRWLNGFASSNKDIDLLMKSKLQQTGLTPSARELVIANSFQFGEFNQTEYLEIVKSVYVNGKASFDRLENPVHRDFAKKYSHLFP